METTQKPVETTGQVAILVQQKSSDRANIEVVEHALAAEKDKARLPAEGSWETLLEREAFEKAVMQCADVEGALHGDIFVQAIRDAMGELGGGVKRKKIARVRSKEDKLASVRRSGLTENC
jgi:hypothetical protein